jgi:hypothetical protein
MSGLPFLTKDTTSKKSPRNGGLIVCACYDKLLQEDCMDVASPLIEYANSGRMMSMDEISEIIKVVRSADKYKANADRLAEALRCVIDAVDYQVAAKKARDILAKHGG